MITNKRMRRLGLHRELVAKALPGGRITLVKQREQRDDTGILKMAVKVGRNSDGAARTEIFEVGRISDVIAAHAAINRLTAQVTT